MKKTILILLSLAAFAAFVGCSNSAGSSGSSGNSSSGGPDLSGVTDTSASWTSQTCWIELNKSGNTWTCTTCTTEDKSGETSTETHLWRRGTQWALSNPGFTKLTSITGYQHGNIDVSAGTMTVNLTLGNVKQEANSGIFAWKNGSNAYIAMQETHHIAPRQNGDTDRIIFIFDNNTKLELFY